MVVGVVKNNLSCINKMSKKLIDLNQNYRIQISKLNINRSSSSRRILKAHILIN